MRATKYKPADEVVTHDITHYERGMTDGSRDALAGVPYKGPTGHPAYENGYDDGYKHGEQTRHERVQRMQA